MRSRNCWRLAGRLIRALVKHIILLGACLLASSASAEAPTNVPAIVKTVGASLACLVAVNKAGADKSAFKGDPEWISSDDGSTLRHRELPIEVTFPKDTDGVARNCEVRAKLSSKSDQGELTLALGTLLGTKLHAQLVQQNDSMIWMLSTKKGPRGLQFFPDKTSDRPDVRLVSAAF